jgi:hypothetical protein
MSALQQASLSGAGAAQLTPVQRAALAAVFWEWFRSHADDVIVKRKVIFFTVTIHVRDLTPLFEALFGPE